MQRRLFTRMLAASAAHLTILCSPLGLLLRNGWARARKRLLPPDTDLGTLIYEDPDALDPRRLPLTPIERFGTAGTNRRPLDLRHWRLAVGGAVARPLSLDHAQLLALPTVERNVLLICPGSFAFYARWRGVSLWELLQRAGLDPHAGSVAIGAAGAAGSHERSFPLCDVASGDVFLAHSVNGRPLPEAHGFPLRAVARGYVGSEWVKWAQTVTVKVGGARPRKHTESSVPALMP